MAIICLLWLLEVGLQGEHIKIQYFLRTHRMWRVVPCVRPKFPHLSLSILLNSLCYSCKALQYPLGTSLTAQNSPLVWIVANAMFLSQGWPNTFFYLRQTRKYPLCNLIKTLNRNQVITTTHYDLRNILLILKKRRVFLQCCWEHIEQQVGLGDFQSLFQPQKLSLGQLRGRAISSPLLTLFWMWAWKLQLLWKRPGKRQSDGSQLSFPACLLSYGPTLWSSLSQSSPCLTWASQTSSFVLLSIRLKLSLPCMNSALISRNCSSMYWSSSSCEKAL